MTNDLYQKPIDYNNNSNLDNNALQAEQHYTFIKVRKLAALDIFFHGATFILVEFALAVFLCAALGLFILRVSNHSPVMVILAGLFLGIALNYIPLLLYAIRIVKSKSAQQVAAFELEHKEKYAGKYMLQSILFLLIPFAMFLLAVYQVIQKRNTYDEINQ